MAQAQYAGTGRRKNAVARVRLVPGTGKITVNKKDLEEYIPHADLRLVINQPFAVTSTEGSYDVHVNVVGGGYAGQSGAIRHGIARALLQVDPDFRDSLKRAGLLTRDARMVERKKPGLKKARKASRFSKRFSKPYYTNVYRHFLVSVGDNYSDKSFKRLNASASCWCFFSGINLR